MNKKSLPLIMLLLISSSLFAGEEETLQQKIDSLENENIALTNKLNIQNKYLLVQHGFKMLACASCIGIPLTLMTLKKACNEQEMQQCLKDAELKGATIGITTIAGAFLLLEIIYLLITSCMVKQV